MKKISRLILFAAVCTVALQSTAASWRKHKKVDDITDATTYIITRDADKYDGPFRMLPFVAVSFCPSLTNSAKFVHFHIAEKLPSGALDIIVRFDKEKPQRFTWKVDDDGNLVTPRNHAALLSKMLTAEKMAMRFDLLGKECTAVFSLSGLSNEIKESERDYLGKPPPTKSCKRCKNSGYVIEWVSCKECGGTGMNQQISGAARCKYCVRSAKKGRVREKVLCPDCQNEKRKNPSGFGASSFHSF